MRKKGDSKAGKKKPPEVVRLEDLAPRKAVKGGGRRVFGEPVDPPEGNTRRSEGGAKHTED